MSNAEPRFGQVWETNTGHRLSLLFRASHYGTEGWAVDDLTVASWRDAPTWAGEPPVTEADAIEFISDFALSESRLVANPGI